MAIQKVKVSLAAAQEKTGVRNRVLVSLSAKEPEPRTGSSELRKFTKRCFNTFGILNSKENWLLVQNELTRNAERRKLSRAAEEHLRTLGSKTRYSVFTVHPHDALIGYLRDRQTSHLNLPPKALQGLLSIIGVCERILRGDIPLK